MANIPENTTDPILRPVTRLETTTKVFGGAYIPDDEQQRGISNLQAIELAERDQYIISRVGQPYVPESGDIPAEVGIAPLDENGKVPKAQNTANVVFTADTQTLTNKTISYDDNTMPGVVGETDAQTITNKTLDAKNNTISCSPTTITSNTTITPTKEMNVVVTTSYACVTVASSAPYIGYQLPITFSGCIGFVKFNSVCEAINRASITLIWTGTTWTVQSGATFFLSDVVYTNRPTGTTPSNWKDFVGVGEYNFTYAYTGGDYDIPLANSNITMTWRNSDAVSAIAVNSFVNSISVNTTTQAWVRRGNGTPLVWATDWTPIFPMIYSTTEFDTGMKWTDGKRIYCKIINDIGTWSLTANTNDNKTVSITGASEVLEVTGKFHINYNSGQSEWDAQLPYILLGSHFVCVNGAGNNFFTMSARFLADTVLSNFAIKVLYTK